MTQAATKNDQITYERRMLLEALLLLALVVGLRIASFWTSLIDPDESIFAIAAREVLKGHLPYMTFFDIKPVGSTLILAAWFKLLGENLYVVRFVGLISVWLSALLLKRLGRLFGLDQLQAFAAAATYVAFSTSLHGLATMTEIMLSPFTIGCVLLLVMMLRAEEASRQIALTAAAGLACGLAVLIKIVPIAAGGAALAAVLLLCLVRHRIGLRRGALLAFAFGVGASVPMALVALTYWRTGHLSTFTYANYEFASVYRAQGRSGLAIGRQFIRVFGQLWPLVAFSTVTLAIAGRQMLASRSIPTFQFVCASWLAGELIAASASGHFEEHYFLTALPPLCLLAIHGIVQVHKRMDPAATLAPLLLASSMAMVPVVPALARTVPPAITGSDLSAQATAAIKRAAHGRELTLLVADQDFAGLYMSTGAPVPSRYAQPLILMGGLSGLARSDMRLELRRVLATRPEFIVTNSDRELAAWVTDELDPVLATSYRQIATVSEDAVLDVGVRHRNDLYIYQRTGPAGHRDAEARTALSGRPG